MCACECLCEQGQDHSILYLTLCVSCAHSFSPAANLLHLMYTCPFPVCSQPVLPGSHLVPACTSHHWVLPGPDADPVCVKSTGPVRGAEGVLGATMTDMLLRGWALLGCVGFALALRGRCVGVVWALRGRCVGVAWALCMREMSNINGGKHALHLQTFEYCNELLRNKVASEPSVTILNGVIAVP